MPKNQAQEQQEEVEEFNHLEKDLEAAAVEEAVEEKSGIVKKYEFIEDISGVGPATAQKLRELGYRTVEALAMATMREIEAVGVSDKKASQIIQAARSAIGVSFIRADQLLKQRQNVARLSTGSKALDKLVAGGLETQSITEFYGEYGSGKSQVCHQLCVNVQLSLEKGGLNGGVLYIDTENTFRLERIVQMANHLGLNPEEVVKNIIYAEAYTSDHQMFLLENSDEVIKANNIKLIIVDSLMAHFRSEYIGREMLASRQQKLNKHMHKLNALARAFNAVAVVTNQVMAKPDQFFSDPLVPVGGNIVGHTSQTRIALRRASKGEVRIARLVSSPYLPDGEEVLKVTANGIEDMTEEEKAAKKR
ncbi:MAG: DNA repair and recombination protein RadA [Nitrososphaerota archaeon]|jgi:DNA repair protein RadA|nr:DNA repair and recombination protein RadA [Nitrososphaerota archaeon]